MSAREPRLPPQLARALHPVLERLSRSPRRGAPPPLAVLDFDNTCIRGDSGDMMHVELAESRAYSFTDAFWQRIAPEDGRERLRTTWERVHIPPAAPTRDDLARFTDDLIAVYARHLARRGPAATFDWAVTLHVDLRPEDIRRTARALFSRALAQPLAAELRRDPEGRAVHVHRGARVRSSMAELVGHLHGAGFDVWIVSATCQWTVEALAPRLGVPATRVIGNRCVVRDGRITAERDGPTTWRSGKVDAVDRWIGRRPAIAIGDSWTDAELLASASDLAILVDRGDPSLRALATSSGWLIVPAEDLDDPEPDPDSAEPVSSPA